MARISQKVTTKLASARDRNVSQATVTADHDDLSQALIALDIYIPGLSYAETAMLIMAELPQR